MKSECYVNAAAGNRPALARACAQAIAALMLALPGICAAQPSPAQPPSAAAPPAAAPSLPATIYRATSVREALAALGATDATASGRLLIDAPDIHDSKLPVPVRLRSELPNTDALVLIVERSPKPVAAAFAMRPMQQPEIVFQLPFARTSSVMLLARSDGKWFSATRTIRMAVEAWK
jgi:predicted secreted protein